MGEIVESGEMRAELNPAHHGAQLQADAPRQTYVVAAESGIFKRGEQINKGEHVELDAHTAAQFIASGDIEEAPVA